MAKAKNQTSGKTTKSAGAKKAKPADAPAAPQIDTSLAAASAAKLVAAKAAGIAGTASASGAARESAAFKNLKDQLANPTTSAASSMASLLDKAGSPSLPKTHHVPFGSKQQIGRNQTFGADVNRTGVPRRTGGG